MLSYQHQFHAGNFADVHKHLCLRVLFESLLKKDKPFCYIDCHAGSGRYDLQCREARKTNESASGIGRIWRNPEAGDPAALAAYFAAIANLNTDGQLRHYPGSPELARQWLRHQDSAILFELHPQAQKDLHRHFGSDRRFNLHARDSFEGLVALVPPPVRRGLVLLDPSYEVKSEYSQVAALVARAQRRWANGIYAIWYPLLPAGRHLELLGTLEQAGLGKILVSELVAKPLDDTGGMHGSGIVIVNTPWQVDDQLASLMPVLAGLLAPGQGKATMRWLDQADAG